MVSRGRRALLLALAGLGLAACARAPRRPAPQAGPRWPPPPDPARVWFLGHLQSHDDLIRSDARRRWRQRLGGARPSRPLFQKPYGLSARGGRLVVSDTVGRRVLLLDLAQRTVLPLRGGREALAHPLGVAQDGRGRIYVVDGAWREVRVFDPWGHAMLRLGRGQLRRPRDVAVDEAGERIYVLDVAGPGEDAHGVVVLDRGGRVLARWGRRGRAPGHFNLPNQIAVDRDGRVLVLDAGNFRVQILSPAGEPLHQFGRVGRRLGDLARPRGLAVDADGRIYVTDAAFQNFQIFDAEGRLLLPVGGAGDGPGQFLLPAGIAVDGAEHIFVADQLLRRVSVFRLSPPA